MTAADRSLSDPFSPRTEWGLRDEWFPVCLDSELSSRAPKAVTLQGVDLVLFRDKEGAPVALLDRCPHRNVPLSCGRVGQGEIECMYHGWRFGARGECTRVPGLQRGVGQEGQSAPALAARVQQGMVWVYSSAGEAKVEPFSSGAVGERGYTTVVQSVDFPANLAATVENALDVPHTAFLHRGLFRGAGEPNPIEVEVTRGPRWVQAEYLGEPRPSGLAGWLLSPSGGTVQHWDRFMLPCVAQVEYKLGSESHILVTSYMTPVTDTLTRAFAVVSFRVPLPGWLIKPFIMPIAMRIFRQDARVLALQSEAERRWGERVYFSTEIDVLGAQVQRLLKRAQQGRLGPDERRWSKRLTMMVG